MTDVHEDDDDSPRLRGPEYWGSGLADSTKKRVLVLALDILDNSDDLRVFEQEEAWFVGGLAWPLDLMDDESLFDLLAFLFANADYFHIRMLHKITAELLVRSMQGGEPDPDLPVVKAARLIMDTEPAEWLYSTPLIRKLNHLLDR